MRLLIMALIVSVTLTANAAPTPEQTALIQYLQSEEEPSIKDATWMMDDHLYVAVFDDGSNRSGFAEYVCMTATAKGAHAAFVKVVDMAKLLQEKKFHELGKAHCPKPDPDGPTEVTFN